MGLHQLRKSKKHLEAAGLNPALLYGMSGGGGATAAGAQGMGAGIASGHEMGIKRRYCKNQN